jgi:uncharacterized tellurite resistance protein B-like protein
MEPQEKLLKDYSVQEKSAYLNAIAAIATADSVASQEELSFLDALAQSAELPQAEADRIRQTASAPATDSELKANLDVLKNSDLRFSLLTDLMAFAESDQNYSVLEKQTVQNVATYLGIDQQQFATLNQFVDKAAAADIGEEAMTEPQGLLRSLGMENQFKNAGINFGSISKGLLGMIVPMILGRMMRGRSGGGSFGGGLGGLLGGLLGGAMGGRGGGGFGSLISMLNGRQRSGNIGGMFGRMFG